MPTITALLLASLLQAPTPLDFGRAELNRALGSHSQDVRLEVKPGRSPEAYEVSPLPGGKVHIVGSDATGAMYGAFQFLENLHLDADKGWKLHTKNQPYLAQRGVNLFLTLPWDYQRNKTDDDVAALTDPKRWWFHDEKYWVSLLDLMAHSRLNWLDIHGAWDIDVTDAPNLYAYFVTSPSFPLVGVPEATKAADLRQLNHVIDLAHERGIKVSLMAYEARFHTPQNPNPPYKSTEANLYKYTREVVEKMIRGVPGLDAIGFRIGESGHGESFFKCYQEAVKASGRDIPLITRTWITRKQNVLALARQSKDFTAEIKYNGEQWGAPYIVAGGRMANWYSYSFEDYLSDSGPGKSAKMWPGNPAEGGGTWPSEPYKIVWQVRANGTHRIFPFYNPDWVRRTINEMKIGTASGYTVEGEDAYFPKDPLYYLANPADKYCDYIHERDSLYWMSWGRLGYDPTTPDSVFDSRLTDWFGSDGPRIAEGWKAASQIVPLAYMAHALGPDHRDHAPELETGGGLDDYISGQPFDPFVIKPGDQPFIHDGRMDLGQVAWQLELLADKAGISINIGDDKGLSPEARLRFKELRAARNALCSLGQFYYHSFWTAQYAAAGNQWEVDFGRFRSYKFGEASWKYLSNNPFYRPFTDRLRMHTNSFAWASELPGVEANAVDKRQPHGSMFNMDPVLLPLANLRWKGKDDKVVCSLHDPTSTKATLLYKPLPSTSYWHSVAMAKKGDSFEVAIDRPNSGLCLAAEVVNSKGDATRTPSFANAQAPYLVVPAKAGATPQIYGTDQALTYLDPSILTPDKFGTMIIAPRAARFFGFSRAEKRKLLEGVKAGMKLLILQQDFLAKRYSLDFLPKPIAVAASKQADLFDGAGQLGLGKIEQEGIQWQQFRPSEGWEIFGSGGLARMKLGKGEIWMTSARLMQNAIKPQVSDALKTLLNHFKSDKPAILIDAGTESAVYTTSFWPDVMNAFGIPFLTLGEAIAQEQKMDSLKPIPGPVNYDDVLGGRGSAQANAFLRKAVVKAASRPTPKTVADFETERVRRKKILMRSLGLDPLPARTPLNARVTGRIDRGSYTIEKVVIESRPKFFVTMHVYVPTLSNIPTRRRLPVVMNVNGHWAHKKDEDRIQLRCAFQALQGYLAVAVDSPGHSFEGNALFERAAEGDHNDYKLVEGGSNATGYYVWDTMRALDYIATRPEADMTQVGITGASGGGLASLYCFAVDNRYKAAVPVVYMASMEQAPDNGCLCNHVPGTLQIGDRSDVIAIAAPKPVLIMGAEQDGEFPAAATVYTHKKMAESWSLLGHGDDVFVKIFPGGHDYNQGMREASIGFFNHYLQSSSPTAWDGKSVPQPLLTAIDPEDRQLLVLDPPAQEEVKMRDVSRSYLDAAPAEVSAAEAIAINGGLPSKSDLHYAELGSGRVRTVTFESEAGLVTPGVLFLPKGKAKGVRIVADDRGKAAAIAGRNLDEITADGYAYLFVDILATGELSDIELRYTTYLGCSPAFRGGWQLVRAADAMRHYSSRLELIGSGPISSQAVMWAGLQAPKAFGKITGHRSLATWQSVFDSAVPDGAVQPLAHLCGSLDHLRMQVKNGAWE